MITRRCLNVTALQYLAAHCVPVSATASRQHHSAFCCQSSAGSNVISTEFLWTSGLLCCRSDDVELSTETFADPVHTTSVFARLLKTFFFRVLAYTAHYGLFFGVDALYKLTFYLLTYLLILSVLLLRWRMHITEKKHNNTIIAQVSSFTPPSLDC